MRNGINLGQVRATSVTNTTVVVPFPTTQGVFGTVPGLSAGPVTVNVYNQTAAGNSSWGLVGSTALTVNDTRTPPSVNSITPNPVDLASPPTSFTITGSGFANLGFGLPVVNFVRNGINLGQVRADFGHKHNCCRTLSHYSRCLRHCAGTQRRTGDCQRL